MKKQLVSFTLTCVLVLSACATNNTKVTTHEYVSPKSSKALLIEPDVELSVLMASGMTEVRADWSKDGAQYLSDALAEELKARGSDLSVVGLDGLTPRQVQLIKLNDVVMQTSLQHDYFGSKLPTHEDKFIRTIGPGATVLKGQGGADYALMVRARGSYSSAGKVAMNIAMAALGGSVQTGSTQLFATLVDLDTGNVIWSNLAGAAMGADMRTASGSESVVRSLLKDFPLGGDDK